MTIGGGGEWATASYGYGAGNDIVLLKELHFPDSLGLLYSAFTYFTGFRVLTEEVILRMVNHPIMNWKRVERRGS